MADRELFPPVSTLLTSKLRPPVAGGPLVSRSRFDNWLAAAARAKLVLFRAPAGFGKTSAMLLWREHLRERGIPTAWLTLSEADNDPAHFLVYLTASFQRIDPSLEMGKPGATFGVSPAELLRNILDWSTRLPQNYAMFLDEFEVVRNPEVHAIIQQILEHLPEGGLLLMSTRETPSLQINRLRARRQLVHIGLEDLRFSAIETERFMRQEGASNLDGEDLFLLHQRTEGWAAGLQLTALALAGRHDGKSVIRSLSGSHADIADYLAEDVLSRQPEEVRDFLLKTSILDRLSGPLCDALTGRSDGYEMLSYLERSNLFVIFLDDEHQWFRYHALFGQFLRGRLERQSREQAPALHRCAADWFSENGRLEEAAAHLLEAGEEGQAAELMAGCWRKTFTKGLVGIVAGWVERLPAEILERHPELTLAYCWTLCARGRYDEGRTALAQLREQAVHARLSGIDRDEVYTLEPTILLFEGRIEECHRAVEENLPKLTRAGTFAHGVSSNVLGFCLTTVARFDEAAAILKRAQRSHSQAGSMYGTVYALCFDGWGLLSQGHLRTALVRYRAAFERAREVSPGYSIPGAVAATYLAGALYEADDLVEAERLLTDHFSLIPEGSTLDIVVLAHLTLARIRFLRSEKEEAARLLELAEAAGQELGMERSAASIRLERGRLALFEGNIKEAERCIRGTDVHIWESLGGRSMPGNATETWEIGTARLAIHKGDFTRALALLRSHLKVTEAQGRLRRALKVRVLLAVALGASGDRKSALRTLDSAVRWAAPEGFIRTFIDEGVAVVDLLRELRKAEVQAAAAEDDSCLLFLDHLLEAAGCEVDAAAAEEDTDAPEPAEELSGRESEMLQLLAKGLSNQGIADRLFVSVATVKFHLRNINMKLGAANRTEAVSKARRLGLLS